MLAVPFAKLGMAVTAADPEPDMLAAAEEAAAAAGVPLELWQGGSYDLTPDMGPYRLVSIGRAFTGWTGPRRLAMLDRIVAPGGARGAVSRCPSGVDGNRWFKTLCEVGDHIGRASQPHIAERKALGHRRYEPFLFRSAFTELDGLSVTIRQTLSEDDIVGRAFSQVDLFAGKAGRAAPTFEAELRAGC